MTARHGIILVAAILILPWQAACRRQPPPPAAAVHTPVERSGNTLRFPPDAPQLSRITVRSVEEATVPMGELAIPARVEMIPARTARLTPPVTGRVVRLLVSLGEQVRAGQPLLTLDSAEGAGALAALRQAEAAVAQEQAARTMADAELERARDLFEHRAIAQREVLAAETLAAQTHQTLAAAEAARDEAAQRLRVMGLRAGSAGESLAVTSTMPGKVVEITAAPGEFRNEPSEPLLTVADLSRVWVAGDVPESEIRHVELGQAVTIVPAAYPDRRFDGRVVQMGDLVDPQTRTIRVRAEVDNREGLFRPEMFAQMTSVRGEEVLPVVPRAAVYQRQEGESVYRELGPGTFEEVAIVVAWQDGDRVAIRSGLRPGDRVVTDGVTLLRAY